MTEDLKETILNLYERGLLIVRVPGRWIDKSVGQERVSVVVYEDCYYQITQRRYWWSNSESLDSGWRYGEPDIVQVVYKTKVKKITTKFWQAVE